MPPKKKDKGSSIAATLAALRKEEGASGNFGFVDREKKFLSTGNLGIDAICNGGLPVGKMVEAYGPSGCGKTTMAIQTAAQVQAEGGIVLWLDFERAFDKPYASSLGLHWEDEDSFIYYRPKSLEDGARKLIDLLNTGELTFIVVDSIARMTTESEMDNDIGKATVADKAKALYKLCRIILNPLDDYNTTILFLNHLLVGIATTSMPGAPKVMYTPGGNGVTYFSSLRLEFKHIKSIKTDVHDSMNNEEVSEQTAAEIKVLVTKNRQGKPAKVAVVRNVFGEGFSQVWSAFDALIGYGAIKKAGTWFTPKDPDLTKFLGDDKIQGEANVVARINANPELRGTVITKARDFINSTEWVAVETDNIPRDDNGDPLGIEASVGFGV